MGDESWGLSFFYWMFGEEAHQSHQGGWRNFAGRSQGLPGLPATGPRGLLVAAGVWHDLLPGGQEHHHCAWPLSILKYFIIFYPNDHRRLNDLKSVEKWRTLKLSWLPHEPFKQMIEWANGWRVQFNTGEQFETRFQIDFRCSRIPIGMIPPFTFPLWNFS